MPSQPVHPADIDQIFLNRSIDINKVLSFLDNHQIRLTVPEKHFMNLVTLGMQEERAMGLAASIRSREPNALLIALIAGIGACSLLTPSESITAEQAITLPAILYGIGTWAFSALPETGECLPDTKRQSTGAFSRAVGRFTIRMCDALNTAIGRTPKGDAEAVARTFYDYARQLNTPLSINDNQEVAVALARSRALFGEIDNATTAFVLCKAMHRLQNKEIVLQAIEIAGGKQFLEDYAVLLPESMQRPGFLESLATGHLMHDESTLPQKTTIDFRPRVSV